jgi:hypothetical protein
MTVGASPTALAHPDAALALTGSGSSATREIRRPLLVLSSDEISADEGYCNRRGSRAESPRVASRGKAGRPAHTCIAVDKMPGDHDGGAGDRAPTRSGNGRAARWLSQTEAGAMGRSGDSDAWRWDGSSSSAGCG